MRGRRAAATFAALLAPVAASAHGFGRLYNLPVPFWLYAWAASATLLLSFLLIAWFAAAPSTPAAPAISADDVRDSPHARPWVRGLALFLLLLCIATGWLGTRDPAHNFSMTFFWIVFVLGVPYACAVVGNFYAPLNPWRTLADLTARMRRDFLRGRVTYPQALGDWPALTLYLAFVAFELFGHGKTASLATMLAAYSALNLLGAWLIGAAAWFRHCEFFGVFLRLVALMAPLDRRTGAARWRAPLSGLVDQRPQSLSTVVFALAMLSTTAFDGLRATQWWVGLFWKDPTGIVTALAGNRPIMVYPMLRAWYIGWEAFWLLASPFVYLGAYLLALSLARLVTRSTQPLRTLALDFGYTLLPIALVYHLTHYATLILSQGVTIVSLFSDPFGRGWNLLGTAHLWRAPILPPMGTVWHTQVALILLGHVASVLVAHRVALRVWPSRRTALLSQLPMLALMVLFTVAGLWILAQPLTELLMR